MNRAQLAERLRDLDTSDVIAAAGAIVTAGGLAAALVVLVAVDVRYAADRFPNSTPAAWVVLGIGFAVIRWIARRTFHRLRARLEANRSRPVL